MVHEIAGDIIYFDNPKENTSHSHIVEPIDLCLQCVCDFFKRDFKSLPIPLSLRDYSCLFMGLFAWLSGVSAGPRWPIAAVNTCT